MKKVLLFVVAGIMMFGVASCGSKKKEEVKAVDKKATNLTELKKKYEGKELKSCDEAIAFATESFDVYFAAIDKAYDNGDEEALKDIEEFSAFFESFSGELEKFENECPEKIKAFEDDLDKKFDEYFPKLMELSGMGDMGEGEYEETEVTE